MIQTDSWKRALRFTLFMGLMCALTHAQPIIIADSLNYPERLAIHEGFLYFIDNAPPSGFIKRVPVGGGTVETLVSSATQIGELHVEGDLIAGSLPYEVPREVFTAPSFGGSLTPIPCSVFNRCLVGLLNGEVYYQAAGGIGVYPPCSSIAGGHYVGMSLVRGGNIYFAEDPLSPSLYMMDSAENFTRLTDPMSAPTYLTADDLFVYFTEGGKLKRVPQSETPAKETIYDFAPARMVADGHYVYFPEGGSLQRLPVGGGAAYQLAVIDAGTFHAVAVDASAVYWTDMSAGNGNGIIWKLGKTTAWEELGGSASGGGISNTPEISVRPAAVVDAEGRVVVAWNHDRPDGYVYARRSEQQTWMELGGSASGSGLSTFPAGEPALALDGQGRILVTYTGGGLHFRRWNGTAWEELAGSATGAGLHGFSVPGEGPCGLFVTHDGEDKPIVGMSYGNFPQQSLYVYLWNGSSWASDHPPDTFRGYFPAVAPDGGGGFWMAFDKGDWNGDTSTIEVYHYSGGSWSKEVSLTAQANNRAASIAVDSQGRVVVAWMSGAIDNPGSYRVMVSRWNGVSWVGLAGSDTGDGISFPCDDAGLPEVVIAEGDMPVVGFIQEGTSNWVCVKVFDGASWTNFGDGSATEPGLGYGCNDVVYYRDPPTAIPGWVPLFKQTALATNSQGVFFCAWEGAGEENIFGKVYGLDLVPQGEYQYVYDDVQRLTDIRTNNGITISYEYDRAGNRGQKEVTSQLLLSAGDANPASGGVDNSAVDKPVMQLALDMSDDEDLVLTRIEFGGSGTGNDATAISEAKLWRDSNGDGVVDGGDVQLGSTATFSGDNGVLVFWGLAETLSGGARTHLLLTYTFNGSALENETFGVSLANRKNISAEGAVSGEAIYVLGAPVTGATLTMSTDTSAPVFAGLQTATPQDAAVYLEWLVATDSSTPITYRIWQSTESFAGIVTGPPDYSTSALVYLVEGLINGQTYYFAVRAEDGVGNRDENTEERSTMPEGVIHTLTVTAVNGTVAKSPDLPGYEAGTYVGLAATGDPGYHFTGWSGDNPAGHEMLSPLTLLMDADKTLDAAFVRSTGTVVVAVTPNDATWSFVDGEGLENPGSGDVIVLGVPTGQILFSWNPYPGYTSPPMSFPELASGGTVTITGVYGSPLSFLSHPQSQRLYTGDTAEFSVETASGLGFLSYLWKFDDGQKALTDIGGDSPVLTIPALTPGDAGPYWCEVSDQVPATYVSETAMLEVADHLAIVVPPEGGDYTAKDSHTFSVTVTGGFAPLVYTWKKDEQTVSEDPVYTIDSLEVADSGFYTVEVVDDNGEVVVSESVQLTVEAGIPAVNVLGLGLLLGLSALSGIAAMRRQGR